MSKGQDIRHERGGGGPAGRTHPHSLCFRWSTTVVLSGSETGSLCVAQAGVR